MGVLIKGFNYVKKNEMINPFERKSFVSAKEKSQRGDLYDQSDSSKDNPPMNEERQNSMNSSDNEELIPKNREENKFDQEFPNDNYQNMLKENKDKFEKDNEIINDIYAILKYLKIIVKININDKNKFKYEKIIYYEGKKVIEITYEQLKRLSEKELVQKYDYEICFNLLENLKKIIGFLNKIEEITNKFDFKIKPEEKLFIEIELKEDINKNIKIINSEYTIIDRNSLKIGKYQDKDILNLCNYKNFESFINIINVSTNFTSNYPKNISKNYLISFKKIIGKLKEFAENIRELNDGSIKSDGKKVEFNINELNSNKKIEDYYKNKCKFLFPPGKNVVYITLKNNAHFIESNTSNSNIETIYSCNNLFKLKNNYIICDKDGLYYGPKINDPEVTDKKDTILVCELSKEHFIGGIKINDDFTAFMSNGKNKLIFYNTNSKQILMENESENENENEINYSFNSSGNFCSIMKVPKSVDNKLLLAACKKYIQGEKKNEILLIELQYNKDKNEIKTSKKFYDTKNFEVFCFCPLFNIENKKILKKDNAQIFESEYFLVGGFDTAKGEGLIKLYKVIYSDKINNTEIELIQDNIIEKMEGQNNSELFKSKKPITCIEQTSEGEILVVYNKNVYLFSAPKILDPLES